MVDHRTTRAVRFMQRTTLFCAKQHSRPNNKPSDDFLLRYNRTPRFFRLGRLPVRRLRTRLRRTPKGGLTAGVAAGSAASSEGRRRGCARIASSSCGLLGADGGLSVTSPSFSGSAGTSRAMGSISCLGRGVIVSYVCVWCCVVEQYS